MTAPVRGTRIAVHQIAVLAADAARQVPGVARLQPGVRQVAIRWGRQMAGQTRRDTGGIEVRLRTAGPTVDIEIAVTLVVDGSRPATEVARTVQRFVAATVAAGCGHPVAEVSVLVVGIEYPG